MAAELIALIEDEATQTKLLTEHLVNAGYEVEAARSEEEALPLLQSRKPACVLLDLMLGESDGLLLCERIKNDPQFADIPVIIVSSKSSDAEITAALEKGADDYLTKPVPPKLLISRLHAVLKRGAHSPRQTHGSDGLHLDLVRKVAEARGKSVELTEMEFNILRFLMEHPGLVYTPYQISQELRSELLRYVNPRKVEKDVYDLRNKLAMAGDYLENVVGVGIRFCEE